MAAGWQVRGGLAAALAVGIALGRAGTGQAADAPRPAKAAGGRAEAPEAGVTVNRAAGTIEAVGSCAADLRAPSAEVARIKAERVARSRALDRIRRAMLSLPRPGKGAAADRSTAPTPPTAAEVDKALAAAETVSIDHGANGTVTLRLRAQIPVAARAAPAAPAPATPAEAGEGASQPAAEHDK